MKRLVLLLVILGYSPLYANTANDALQTKLNDIRTMSASFNQEVKAKQESLSESSGTMALSRPGRFRWHTKEPMAQIVVADGDKLWVYDVELEQVTVKKQAKGIGGTAALFLSGYDDTVARDFDVSEQKQGEKTTFDLKATSEEANFQRVKLIFQGKQLTGMELFDQLGQHTLVHLSNIQLNPDLSASLFQFKAPKGVDVVKQ